MWARFEADETTNPDVPVVNDDPENKDTLLIFYCGGPT